MRKEITMGKAMFLNKNLRNSNVGDEKIDLDSIILPILIDTFQRSLPINALNWLFIYLLVMKPKWNHAIKDFVQGQCSNCN